MSEDSSDRGTSQVTASRTVEHRVGDKTTRIDRLVVTNCHRLTISTVQIVDAAILALELVCIQALHVTTMVLEEISELVVEQDGRLEVCRNGKFDNALVLVRNVGRRVLDETVLRRGILRL